VSWSARYRSEAAQCLAAARAAEHRDSKALFLMMADAWVRLADQVEAKARPSAGALDLLKQFAEAPFERNLADFSPPHN
jgi:hypothetical protein